jgi:hypothetical protein
MTRAVVCAMHGRFHESLVYHPLGIPLCLALIAVLIVLMLQAFGLKFNSVRFPLKTDTAWVGILAVFVVAWIVRLCGVDPLPG